MNDPIYILSKKAGLDLLTHYLDDDQWNNIEPRLEKFAELITKECIGICNRNGFDKKYNVDEAKSAFESAELIGKYFGVE